MWTKDKFITYANLTRLAKIMKKHPILLGPKKQRRPLSIRVLPNLMTQREAAEAMKGASDVAPAAAATAADADHQRRLVAANKILGLWTGRTDTPKDGVAFQNEMRAEWP